MMSRATSGAPWKGKKPMRRGGANRRMIRLLVTVWLAAPGTVSGPDECVPRNLRCFKSCCDAPVNCCINCTWEVGCKAEANYSLHFRYPNESVEQRLKPFDAGVATSVLFNQDKVYALKNATIWVERRTADGPPRVSENLTLLISQAVRFGATSAKAISFSRQKSLLTLIWPDPPTCRLSPRRKEARMRQAHEAEWSPGNCNSKDDKNPGSLAVACRLEKNVPYEAQLRYRTSDWSSYWSDWSESIFVPAEILRSPKVNYTVQRLGEDGLRNVTLEWENPGAEHGEVNYSLTFHLLPCRPCLSDWDLEIFITVTVRNRTSYRLALSGAGYNVSVEATNAVGVSPAYSFQIPPERDAGPGFLNINRSGRNLSLMWEAKVDTDVFCVEKQPLGEAVMETPCVKEDRRANVSYNSSVVVEPDKCYRLAVHGWNWKTQAWSTFGLAHLFHRQASLEDPIPVHVTNQTPHSAVVRWEPPAALSDCPGVLEKYVICCGDKEGGKSTHYEANASETQYTIPDLQPRMAYLVGVWAVTAESKENCRAQFEFRTKPPDPKQMTQTLASLYVGILVGVLAIISIFHYGKKRVTEVLCPPSPDPAGIEALRLLTTESGQVLLQRGFLEPLESSGLTEPLVVDPTPGKEEPAAADTVRDLPGLATPAEEPPAPKEEEQVVCGEILPSAEYKGQGFLSPVQEDRPGRERLGEPAGVSREAGADGCPLPSPHDADARGGQGLPQPGAPLPFVLLDKAVLISDSEGDHFAFPCHGGGASA